MTRLPRRITRTAALLVVAVLSLVLTATAGAAAAVTFGDGTYATDLPTAAPSGLTPASGAALPYPAAAIDLAWQSVPGAAAYDLQLARQLTAAASCSSSAAFEPEKLVVSKTMATSNWVPALVAGDGDDLWTGSYCWRVRASGATPGPWSAPSSFTRTWTSDPGNLRFYNDHDGATPRLATDPDVASGSTITRNAGYITWDDVSGASTYEVEVSTSQSFSQTSMMVTRDGIHDSRVLLPHLPDDTYYWRVRAVAPNGTEGSWSSGANAFTTRWLDPTWSDQAGIYPTDSTDQSELRMGWTPMPGASYYEYQVGTGGGCFWDPTRPDAAPDPYGDWVNTAAKYTGANALLATQLELPSQCRLSRVGATTVNNWITFDRLIDQTVLDNIGKGCQDDTGKVVCKPAKLFNDQTVDMDDTVWRGAAMAPGSEDLPASSIYWRVRPVYKFNQATESGWKVSGDNTVYGSWTRYRGGGANREYRYDLHTRDATGVATWPTDTAGTRCDEASTNPTGTACLVHTGSSLRADQEPGSASVGTMQFPVLTWTAFPGAGGYVVQIARDPEFNNIALIRYTLGERSYGFGFQHSLALDDSLADNSEGTGYWWRVIPCNSSILLSNSITTCAPLYSDGSPGLPDEYTDAAVAQTFVKRTAMQTAVSPNFDASTPLLRWTTADVAATDAAGWARGVPGADHYEVQLARDPFMTKDLTTMTTTAPRIVPFDGAGGQGLTELADGTWYFRVRGVDRNGLDGSWSDTNSFTKRVAAPSADTRATRAVGGGTTIRWNAVKGATDYTVQWTTSESFEGTPSEASTRQTRFRIPSATPGSYYWRVRGNSGSVQGLWSAIRGPVEVAAGNRIRFFAAANVKAASVATVYGQLLLDGAATKGKSLVLQRKTVGCNVKGGEYTKVVAGTTGSGADDGVAAFRVKLLQNACFRIAWAGPDGTEYSAPFAVTATPVLKVKQLTRKVRRGKAFCLQVSSNVRATGSLTIEYKVGKKWNVAKTGKVRNLKSSRACASITAAGTFPLRVTLSKTVVGGWQRFADTTVATGSVAVRDAWSVSKG